MRSFASQRERSKTMARFIYVQADTAAELSAFLQGVDFVNDSSIGVEQRNNTNATLVDRDHSGLDESVNFYINKIPDRWAAANPEKACPEDD